jgi:apolipoprotein N-acyltransferase
MYCPIEDGLIEHCREWAERIGLLRGWRRNAMAFIFGILATLTLAPFVFFPLLIFSFTGLICLMNGTSSRKRAFWDGWWWGWGFFISGMYWLNIALIMGISEFWWMIPEALFGLTGCAAVYSGLACWITAVVQAKGLSRLVVFSVALTGMEYLRGGVISDFPWNLIGYSFGFSDAALQLASVIGIYGLTWFAALLGVSFAAFGDRTIPIKRSTAFVTVVWAMFTVSLGFGEWRLHQDMRISESERYVEGVTLRLVQANISESRRLNAKDWKDIVREQARLTRSAGEENITHIIWPETAIPFVVVQDKPLAPGSLEGMPDGKILIAGGDHWKDGRVWNSVFAFNHDGHLLSVFDQKRLVPWGEFIPLHNLIPWTWVKPIVGRMDFSIGTGPRTLNLPGLPPFAPMVCYEVLFPDLASVPEYPPQWLLAITNDGWFGISTGPYQHFEMARLRAIEQGLPLIIDGNTGLSASIDPFGRVLASLGLGKTGILDVKLPKPIAGGTIYGRYGEWFLYAVLAVAALLMAWGGRSECAARALRSGGA